MNGDALSALMRRAVDGEVGEAAEALAELYWALANDTPWRRACADRTAEDRSRTLLAVLRQRRDTPLEPQDGLALLGALDAFLGDQEEDGLVLAVDALVPPLWVVSRSRGWRAPTSRDMVDRWCRLHNVFPKASKGVQVQVSVAPAAMAQPWSGRRHWMVAAFTDGIGPRNDASGAHFHTRALDDPPARAASADQLAREIAGGHPLRALVLPELSLDPRTRDAFLDALEDGGNPPVLTVPGSYHVMDGEHRYNVAQLWGDHMVLVTQRKILPIDLEAVTEVIHSGETVEVVMGPWGTLIAPICRDFMDFAHRELWTCVAPDVALVPSMGVGSTMSGHAKQADALRCSASTLTCMANQPPSGAQWSEPRFGMIQMGTRQTWLEEDTSKRVLSLILDDEQTEES